MRIAGDMNYHFTVGRNNIVRCMKCMCISTYTPLLERIAYRLKSPAYLFFFLFRTARGVRAKNRDDDRTGFHEKYINFRNRLFLWLNSSPICWLWQMFDVKEFVLLVCHRSFPCICQSRVSHKPYHTKKNTFIHLGTFLRARTHTYTHV